MVFRVRQTPQEHASGSGAESGTGFSAPSCVRELEDVLGERLNASHSRALRALREESDSELFSESLLQLGRQAANSDNLEAATLIYRWLQSEHAPHVASVQARAGRELDAIEGRGGGGARAEFLLRRFVREATDPVSLFAMGAAGALFRATRLATMARLAAVPEAGFLTRGFGAQAASALVGFGVEATAFPMLNRLGGEALGRSHSWELNQLGHEVASSFFTLGALKLCGWGSGAAFRRTLRIAPHLPPNFSQQAFQQAGMLTGILAGHGLEEWVGLRPHQDGATTMVDSLVTLLQFNVAGNLSRRAFGQSFHDWERRIDLQQEALQRPARSRPLNSIFNGPVFSVAMEAEGPGLTAAEGSSSGEAPIFAISGESGLAGRPARPDVRIEYPPELEAELSRLETQMRAPDYLTGSREDLLRRRPDGDVIDRLWFHQLKDLLDRLPDVRYSETDDSIFLTRIEGSNADPDGSLVHAARSRLGARGLSDSPALKVVELRISREKFNDFLGQEMGSPEGALSQLGGVIELQDTLKGQLHFLDPMDHEGDRILRIPAPSYVEALLQNAVGAEKVQFHYVDGAIPRDQVMGLRARQVTPVSLSRGMVWFGDVSEWTFPSPFSQHDGIFHASLDARAEAGAYELSQHFYDWLRLHGDGHSTAENLMDSFADGELNRGDFWNQQIGTKLRLYFEDVVSRAEERGDAPNNSGAVDLARLLGRLRLSWLGETVSERNLESHPESNAWERLFQRTSVAVRPNLPYPPHIEAAWQKIERSFAQADYFRGNRRELASRRPDRDAVDAVWLHQMNHFFEVQSKMSAEIRDIEAVFELNPPEQFPHAVRLIREALALLGERGRPGSVARQVVFFGPEDRSETNDVWRWSRYSNGMLVVNETSRFLKGQIRLETMVSGEGRGVVPSVSLLEAMYQVAQGRPVQFHEVPGEIPRDTVMELRRRGISPIGLSRGILPLFHFNSDVHPALFSGHDGLYHGGVLAQMPENYPRTAGQIYDWVRGQLPEGQIRESFLDSLSDLNASYPEQFGMKMFLKMMDDSLRESVDWIQEAPSRQVFWARLGSAEQSHVALRQIIDRDFNSQGGLVRIKGSFFRALAIHERRAATLRSIGERFDALGINAPPLVYRPETLDAIATIERHYEDPNYYEGTREELRAKRPPSDLVDHVWFEQAKDFALRIPGASIDILDAQALREPMSPDATVDRAVVERALDGLPSHPEARQVLQISIPSRFIPTLFDVEGEPQMRFLGSTPFNDIFESSLGRRVQLWTLAGEMGQFRIPSLSLSEKLIQAVHGESQSQFHFVPGVVPRHVVSSLHGKRVSVVGLSGAPVYFPEFAFARTNGAIHPWTFSQHDAFEHAPSEAALESGVLEGADWLATRIRQSFPDSGLRERTLDRLNNFPLDTGLSPYELLSSRLTHELGKLGSELERMPPSLKKSATQEAQIFEGSLRQLIEREFPLHPEFQQNRAIFEDAIDRQEIYGWNLSPSRSQNYLRRIEYPPQIQANWDAMTEQFGRIDYLSADPVALESNRMPRSLVDRHWFFQAEDFARTIPGARMKVRDLGIFFEPSIHRGSQPDLPFIQRAIDSLRPEDGPLSRQVLELIVPNEVFEESLYGDRRHLALGLILHLEDVLDKRVLLAEPTGENILIRVPSLSFEERLLQTAFGADRVNLHYVHGDISRDNAMQLRSRLRSPVGLAQNHIFFGDLEVLTHPFNFTAHDAFFHAPRDARVSLGFAELASRLYQYLGRTMPKDLASDELRRGLAELEDRAVEGKDLSAISRDAIYLLNQAHRMALTLEPAERARELGEINRLSQGLHAWIRTQAAEGGLDGRGRESLESLLALRQVLRQELRAASRSGRRSR